MLSMMMTARRGLTHAGPRPVNMMMNRSVRTMPSLITPIQHQGFFTMPFFSSFALARAGNRLVSQRLCTSAQPLTPTYKGLT